MKQQITVKQLAELSSEARAKLKNAYYPPEYMMATLNRGALLEEKNKKIQITNEHGTYVYFTSTAEFYPLLNIGQMIEYLIDCEIMKTGTATHLLEGFSGNEDSLDLCDELWEEVKEILEK